MNKKLIAIIAAIVVIIGVVVVVGITLGKGKSTDNNATDNNTKEVKLSVTGKEQPFAVAIKFPTKEVEDEVVADCETEEKYSSVKFKNDKITIEVKLDSYVYNTYDEYEAKYGDKETNYTNYVEYLEDADFDNKKGAQKNFQKTKIAGLEAVAYEYNNSMIYVLNNSNFYKKRLFKIVITSNDKSTKISDLLEDKEVKDIVDSIKVSDYIK